MKSYSFSTVIVGYGIVALREAKAFRDGAQKECCSCLRIPSLGYEQGRRMR